ncbi:hypothetical protein [Streptomyces sp. NPDC050121]|uniref:hypothetical protein n=1 Tax=Streptomyces sp. NPDC050121 TaxID=3365601 RepID=UPI0037A94B7D
MPDFTSQCPAPAMTPADIAAHQAATYVRTAPLNAQARAAMQRLETALNTKAGVR